MKKILLPVDGSESCVLAYDHAKTFAQKFGAEVLILNVQDEIPHGYGGVDYKEAGTAKLEKNAQEILKKAKESFEGTEIKIDTKFVIGDAASAIIDAAENEGCDIIIMCTHGMSGRKRFLMGSVANKVVHHASVPVLVLR